jgi:hypothetical protein
LYSFRAAAAELGDVSIDRAPAKGPAAKAAAQLSFRHQPTGKWNLELVAPVDARAAAKAFRQLVGRDNVQVNVPLKKV